MNNQPIDPKYYYHPHSRIINNNPNVQHKQQIINNVPFGVSLDDSRIPVQLKGTYFLSPVGYLPKKRHKSVERVNNYQEDHLRNVFQGLKKEYDSNKLTKMKTERDAYYTPSELVSKLN
jgi:hypothetical protein